MKKNLLLCVIIVMTVSCVSAPSGSSDSGASDGPIRPVRVAFNHIQPFAGLSPDRAEKLEGLSRYLETRIADSPFYELSLEEQDRYIHGDLSPLENGYLLNLKLTDFETGEILASASTEFLSFSDYRFAADILIAQLEGREAAYSARQRISGKGQYSLPEMTDLEGEKAQMDTLLREDLDRGAYYFNDGEYFTAEDVYSDFCQRFDNSLTAEIQEVFVSYRIHAAQQLLLSRILPLLEKSENLADTGDFEGALDCYNEMERRFLLSEKNDTFLAGSAAARSLADTLAENRKQLSDICRELILAKEQEFLFNVNYYGYKQDLEGLKRSFIRFHSYAADSPFSLLVAENYYRKYDFYMRQFDFAGVPFIMNMLALHAPYDADLGNDVYYVGRYEVTNLEAMIVLNKALRDGILTIDMHVLETDIQGTPYEILNLSKVRGGLDWDEDNNELILHSPEEAFKPVAGMSYLGAILYCREVNRMEQRNLGYTGDLYYSFLESDNAYRLPGVDEWRYFAFGGEASLGTEYPGSDNLPEVARSPRRNEEGPFPVGGTVPNELGLYEMAGNMAEWCDYSVVEQKPRIMGGSWEDLSYAERGAETRYSSYIFMCYSDVGFRLFRSYRSDNYW